MVRVRVRVLATHAEMFRCARVVFGHFMHVSRLQEDGSSGVKHCIHAHTYTHTPTHINTYTHTPTQTHTHTHTYTHIYIHIHNIHTYTHTPIHTYIYTHRHTHPHTHIHTHTHTPARMARHWVVTWKFAKNSVGSSSSTSSV